ncbi:MAG: hypothetical protein HEQ38_20260 [Gemmatimonas sp.]|jgi:hypothetical protein|nr:hypothetical protein [Gemmatimonas sp.]
MDLLANAVDAIQVGVEDYHVGTRPRVLAAVRNIHAGILLLLKHTILQKVPGEAGEHLIKAMVEPVLDPSGQVVYRGTGKKTIDAQQIQQRCTAIGIALDWAALRRIGAVRNEVEHYSTQLSLPAIADVITSAMVLVRRIADEHLGVEPRELMGRDTWDAMLKVATVHSEERHACDEALSAVSWESETLAKGIRNVRCAACASDLLRPSDEAASFDDVVLICRACGASLEADRAIPQAVASELAWDDYFAVTDGADEVIGTCPSCGNEAYVDAENRCARCGESVDRRCDRCHGEILLSELYSAPLCGYCDHVMSKDD